MSRPVTLPASVTMRAAPAIPAGEAYRACGFGRQWALALRVRHGFPASDADRMIPTAALASWLVARGVAVSWL